MDFNSQATNWDNEKRTNRAKVIAEQITHAVEFKECYSALEFGCGTGLVSFNLSDKLNDITCIDTSKGMIDMLYSKIQLHKVNNMIAYQYDINDGHLLIPTYDLIYTSMALHHIVDTEKTLANLYSLLKSDGYISIVELNEDDGSFHKSEKDFNGHHGFNQNELKKVLEKVGFQQLESHTFYNNKKYVEEVNVNYSLFIMTGKK